MDSPRIVFVHTVASLVDDFSARAAARLPGVERTHVVNESLLQDLLDGAPTAEVYPRIVAELQAAASSKPDLIVMTCSSTSPAVDLAREVVDVPILKIDDPLARAAVATGARIGVICTATSTFEASTELLRSYGATDISPVLLPDAFTALRAGDRATHDLLVTSAAVELAASVDVIVLAQASMAGLTETLRALLDVPVLSSPKLLFDELVALTSR